MGSWDWVAYLLIWTVITSCLQTWSVQWLVVFRTGDDDWLSLEVSRCRFKMWNWAGFGNWCIVRGSWPGLVGGREAGGEALVFSGFWLGCLVVLFTEDRNAGLENCLWEDDLLSSFGLLSLCVCVLSRWKFIVSVWEEDVDVIGFQPTGGTWSSRNEWNYQGKL